MQRTGANAGAQDMYRRPNRSGATAGILLALGVGKDIAINFSLASGLLLTTSATVAALCGTAFLFAAVALARQRTPASSTAAV